TARDQAALKEQSGQSARGRKNTKPVLHYTLSWAIGENPSPEHMRETALSSLKALGLDQHQAVMAAHSDKEHLHVHIVVNTIHPETGLTAPLKYTKERLSRWAEAYEREYGIHC
ncbi:relaxase/mobilization nuclease domain-containing protein, partial [Microbacteriaceae bacterium K1510]|nr:relaxase/mobilization nuclease domain-containing protein [Microbacteriaceae bacterium K1510]